MSKPKTISIEELKDLQAKVAHQILILKEPFNTVDLPELVALAIIGTWAKNVAIPAMRGMQYHGMGDHHGPCTKTVDEALERLEGMLR